MTLRQRLINWGSVVTCGEEWGSMALTGTFMRNLDDKHRLAVPKRLREQFGEKDLTNLYIATGTTGAIDLYAPTAFDRHAERTFEQTFGKKSFAETQKFQRMFYGRTNQVDLDSQGRIRIPDKLVDFGKLGKNVALVGVYDHVEIWDQARWEQFLETNESQFDEMAAAVYGGDPTS